MVPELQSGSKVIGHLATKCVLHSCMWFQCMHKPAHSQVELAVNMDIMDSEDETIERRC